MCIGCGGGRHEGRRPRNGATCPDNCRRADVTLIAAPFSEMADQLGSTQAGNIAMLGGLLEASHVPFEHQVPDALRKPVRSPKWLAVDLAALAQGSQAVRQEVAS